MVVKSYRKVLRVEIHHLATVLDLKADSNTKAAVDPQPHCFGFNVGSGTGFFL